MDIPRIAPCMPGAELTEIVDPQNFRRQDFSSAWAGGADVCRARRSSTASTKPITARVSKRKATTPRAAAPPMPRRRSGSSPPAHGSKVLIHTDLMLSGAVAQYGRGVGMIQATAAQIINQFASNLRAQLAQQPAAPRAPPPQAAPPRSAIRARPATAPPQATAAACAAASASSGQADRGFSLMARVIWQQIVALFTGRRQHEIDRAVRGPCLSLR